MAAKDGYRVSREMIEKDVRSPFLILSAVFCAAAAVCSIPGIILLFDGEAAELYQLFLSLDYIDESAQGSWLFVRNLTNVLALAVPLLMGIGLWLTVISTFAGAGERLPMWGIKYFSVTARLTRIIVCVTGVLLAIAFLLRAVRYVLLNAFQIGGVLFIFAMLLPECVFLAVVAVIIVVTLQCLKSAVHTVDTIQLNFLTGRNESYGLTAGAVWLLAMLGVGAVVLCVVNRDGMAAVLCFSFAAAADFFLAVWLQCYRKKTGRRALAAYRREKEQTKRIVP